MKTLSPLVLAAVIIGSVLTPTARAAESPSVLLQKGIYAEETEGNLDSAIKIYLQIAAEAAANRAVVAQAQYRLAVCYQKKGNKEQAVTAFNELLRLYPLDTTLIQKVRSQLVELGQSAAETVTLRKIATVSSSWFRTVSPNGRFVTYTGDNGETFTQEPGTGKIWQPIKSNWENYPFDLVFSPDSGRIAFDRYGKGIWVANIDGSGAREIHKAAANEEIFPIAWLANSGRIFTSLRLENGSGRLLATLDPTTGELKRLTLPPQPGFYRAMSTDGRYVGVKDGNVLDVIDLEINHRETLVADHVSGVLGWANGDSELYFVSKRTGKTSVWAAPVKAGKRDGQPKLVSEFDNAINLSHVTPDGRIYYTEEEYTANVWVATANVQSGEILGEPRLLTNRFPGFHKGPEWSKDGKQLWITVGGEQRRFLSVVVASGKEEDFPVANDFANSLRHFSLSSDGSYILVEGRRLRKQGSVIAGIHRYDLGTGKVETLATSASRNWLRSPQVMPDGKSCLFVRQQSNIGGGETKWLHKRVIVRRALDSSQEEIVHTTAGERLLAWPYSMKVSPDGSTLAFATSDENTREEFVSTIELLELRTGKTRVLKTMSPRENVTSLCWAPGGKRIVFSKSTPGNDPLQPAQTEIWSTAVLSGDSVKLRLALPELGEIAVSPDGRQIAFLSGAVGQMAKLWVMEGTQPRTTMPRTSGNSLPIAGGGRTSIKLNEILGPDNSILEPLSGLRGIVPVGWICKSADRNIQRGLIIRMTSAEYPSAQILLSYRMNEYEKPVPTTEVYSVLRKNADSVLENYWSRYDFKYRPASFQSRVISGRPALSYEGDFTRHGEIGTEYATWINGETGDAFARINAPPAIIEKLRPAFESFVESLRLP